MKQVLRLTTSLLLLAGAAAAQDTAADGEGAFGKAAAGAEQRLERSLDQLTALREDLAKEKIELSRSLSTLEAELSEVRLEYQKTTRSLDRSTLDLSNLRSEIKLRRDEATYLSNLFGEYIRNFESRLHIVEMQRYEEPLETAKSAPENPNLGERDVFDAQVALLDLSLGRLEDALGGTRFEGTAVDGNGEVRHGSFVLVGPAAVFGAADSGVVGTAEQRLGSLEPAVIAFANPEDAAAASALVETGDGTFPLDPSLGSAHKVEATEESLVEHIRKGGPVMIPIFAMAGLALLVALSKWVGLSTNRKPSRKRVYALLDAVERRDEEGAREAVAAIPGPTGRMLSAGVAHLGEPRELIEEVMYETVLTTRLKVQRFLPFIAICAASAPLLGLLGTVTGIINTFKLITVFGSGDVKTLSGGISEALITTEFGLIVAIPSLLLHAFLSRKARAIVSRMETSAVAFVNQVSRTYGSGEGGAPAGASVGASASVGALLRPGGVPTPSAPDSELVRGLVALGEKVERLGREQSEVLDRVNAGTRELATMRAELEAAQAGKGGRDS